ncbi:MAG: hypothetical protein AAF585_13720 [Verrucomicrobiota bacterium]
MKFDVFYKLSIPSMQRPSPYPQSKRAFQSREIAIAIIAVASLLIGIVCFVVSFVMPSIPQEMTDPIGSSVEKWENPIVTHLEVAFEPLIQVSKYRLAKSTMDTRGDGLRIAKRNAVVRILYSLPISIGWFTMVGSIVFFPILLKTNKAITVFCSRLLAAATITAAPLIAKDFFDSATVYRSQFHLGVGAYFFVFSYLSIPIAIFLASWFARLRRD